MNRKYRRYQSPKGFSFLDTVATATLEQYSKVAQEIIEGHDFKRIMPPTIDYYDTFAYNNKDNFFRIRDSYGENLALRNDVTLQVLKGITNQVDFIDFSGDTEHRFYYKVPVFHDVMKNSIAIRETHQLGVEILGKFLHNNKVEELILLANKILQKSFGLKGLVCLGTIHNYKALVIFFQPLNLSEGKLHKVVHCKKLHSLIDLFIKSGLSLELSSRLSYLFLLSEIDEEWLDNINQINCENNTSLKTLLQALYSASEKLLYLSNSLVEKEVSLLLEPFLVSNVSYYSDILFEYYLEGISYSPLRGGVYSSLSSDFSDYTLDAAGFSLEISTLIEIL